MPRKAPSNCEEIRLTLGNYERDQLKQIVNAKETQLYLQPFQYVLPVAVIGAAGYAAVAWFMEWWPFGPKESYFGFGWADRYFEKEVFGEEAINAKEAAELKALDEGHAFAVKWLEDNSSPSGVQIMFYRALTLKVATYDDTRSAIVEKYVQYRIVAAEKAAKIREKSEYV